MRKWSKPFKGRIEKGKDDITCVQKLGEFTWKFHISSYFHVASSKNPTLIKIPSVFFGAMSELNVLDLYCTGIESLPSSISGLIKLRGLYLNNCYFLVELPVEIKQLKDLEVLDIRHTKILNLPTEIGELSNIRFLRIILKKLENKDKTTPHSRIRVGKSSMKQNYI